MSEQIVVNQCPECGGYLPPSTSFVKHPAAEAVVCSGCGNIIGIAVKDNVLIASKMTYDDLHDLCEEFRYEIRGVQEDVHHKNGQWG